MTSDTHSTLILCTNVHPTRHTRVGFGHVWFRLERPGRPPETYGAHPSWLNMVDLRDRNLRYAKRHGWNGSDTDIQKDVELHDKHAKAWQSVTWSITPAKTAEFLTLVGRPEKYHLTQNNCVDWACRILGELLEVPVTLRREMVTPKELANFPIALVAYADDWRQRRPVADEMVTTPRRFPATLIKPLFRGVAPEIGARAEQREMLPVRLLAINMNHTAERNGLFVGITPMLIGAAKIGKLAAAMPTA